mmetsp:Transcript_39913/g.61079  ORF Transcript_39913/g.61079 Transcript_39913/m.61079 type:complete len:99 (+) Transcript_39913:1336-1632(+)
MFDLAPNRRLPPAVPKKKGDQDPFKQPFEKQIFSKQAVERKDLYEYRADPKEWGTDPTASILAFRKYGFGGIGNFHTYVSQFPFRGHEKATVEDNPPN